MKARYGWLIAVGTLTAIGVIGCGDGDSASSPPKVNTGATQSKAPAGVSAEHGSSSDAEQASANAAPVTPGITAGGGRFTPPSAGSSPSVESDPASAPSAETKPEKGIGAKPAAKPNPLRGPGAKPAENAAGAELDSPSKPGQSRIALFGGWPKPDAVLVLTGRQNGYIEPCGCAGLVNQKGGLARRVTMIRELGERGWPVAALDVGNQVKRFGRQSEIKFQMAIEGLRQMDYQAIGWGPDDLRLTSGELFAAASEEPHRFVSANVTIFDPTVTPTYRVTELGGLKIGTTTVLGDEYVERVKSDEVATRPAEEGLKEVAAALAEQKCDWQVLLVYGSMEESRKLAQRFPQFQIVVTAGGAEEPAFEPEKVSGSETRLIQVGAKGMYAGVVGLYRTDKTKLRYQRVPLDDRFADAPEMLRLLAGYQDQLRELGLEGLEVKPSPHPSGRTFVGSQKCGDCHTKAYEKWQATGHAKATESLVHPSERSDIQRHFDPECLSCHVTGWEPQKMYPFKSGYLGLTKTPALVASGCENCHGPGSAHVAAEEASSTPASLVKQRRGEMQLPLKAAQQKCVECHDIDNSPKFHHEKAFDDYWRRVAHPGKD